MRRFFLLILLIFIWPVTSFADEVLVLADIHFDPFADCANNKNCLIAAKLNQANAEQWPQIFAQYSHPVFPPNGRETNYMLFSSTLQQIKVQQPKTVIILGDFLAHRFRSLYLKYTQDRNGNHYKNFVLNTMNYITNSIQSAMPADGSVYPVIGNNDSYGGKNCAYTDYCVINNGPFFQDLSKSWAGLFRNEDNKAQFTSIFPKAGYYEIILPNTRDHIIALNTVLFSNKAQGPNIELAAQQQLIWLEQRLKAINAANEKTWIIFHIPPGIDAYNTTQNLLGVVVSFWDFRYSKILLDLVNEYGTNITAVLSGHTHMDGFLILGKNAKNKIIDTFVPSISPIFGNNPSYKIYSYSPDQFTLHNFAAYYLNLQNPQIGWQKEYDFAATYHANDQLLTGYDKITADTANPFSLDYMDYYGVKTLSQPINRGKWNFYWCATQFLNKENYQTCLKKPAAG